MGVVGAEGLEGRDGQDVLRLSIHEAPKTGSEKRSRELTMFPLWLPTIYLGLSIWLLEKTAGACALPFCRPRPGRCSSHRHSGTRVPGCSSGACT